MRVPVKVVRLIVANIHVSLQFCGKAALKRRITLSYKHRASEASEQKIHLIIIIISLFKEDNILSNTITYLTYGPL